MGSKKGLNNQGIYLTSMIANRSTLDGIALIFLIIGIIVLVCGKSQAALNLGWVLIVIGIVKQLLEWKR